MEILAITGAKDLSEKLSEFSESLVLLYFYVDDSAECTQMTDVINELAQDVGKKKAVVLKVNASKDEELAKKYNVSNAPAVVFLQDGEIVDIIIGANVPAFSKKFVELLKQQENIEDRLKKLINQAPVMLFMKGSPSVPRCGFSKQVIALLTSHNAKFETFDILEDYEVREALKKFSNWPTYPQLYAKGELIGGLDILKELAESGELNEILDV